MSTPVLPDSLMTQDSDLVLKSLQPSSVNSPIPAHGVNFVNALILNELIIESSLWQVYNCKLTTVEATQDHPLPFLYHYDTLSDELKSAHPLTPDLLKQFNTPMSAIEACHKLGLPKDSIDAPWQVKIIGTLVMYSETLQLAIRLRFTNTAKARDPIYINQKGDADKGRAIEIAMRHWHFFGDVFVLNRQLKSLFIVVEDGSIEVSPELAYHLPIHQSYQHIPNKYALPLLTELDSHKSTLPYLDDAIKLRLS